MKTEEEIRQDPNFRFVKDEDRPYHVYSAMTERWCRFYGIGMALELWRDLYER